VTQIIAMTFYLFIAILCAKMSRVNKALFGIFDPRLFIKRRVIERTITYRCFYYPYVFLSNGSFIEVLKNSPIIEVKKIFKKKTSPNTGGAGGGYFT